MQSAVLHDVFVSYYSGDRQWVKRLVLDLRARNINVWLDVDELTAGDLWIDRIEQALLTSRCVAVVISRGSMASAMVREESHLALGYEKRLIPMLIDGTEPRGMLRSRQWIDFQDSSEYEDCINQLIAGIGQAGQTAGAAATAPPPRPSRPPATADEVEALKRHIARTSDDAGKLIRIRQSAPFVGLVPATGFAFSNSELSAQVLIALFLSAPAITFLIGWAITQTQLLARRREIRRCLMLQDGLEICRSNFDEMRCPRLIDQFWAIIEHGVNPAGPTSLQGPKL